MLTPGSFGSFYRFEVSLTLEIDFHSSIKHMPYRVSLGWVSVMVGHWEYSLRGGQ